MEKMSGGLWGMKRFLWSLRSYFIVAMVLFIVFTAAAWGVVVRYPEMTESTLSGISAIFSEKDLYEPDPEADWDYVPGEIQPGGVDQPLRINAVRLIASNLAAMAYCVLLGLVPFLFLPMFPLLMNAFIIGAMGGALQTLGMGPGFFLGALAPHGIFELPSLLLSCALGLSLSWGLARKIFHSRWARPFGELVWNSVKVYLVIVLPLTVLAGFLEAYVTPLVMNWMMGAM